MKVGSVVIILGRGEEREVLRSRSRSEPLTDIWLADTFSQWCGSGLIVCGPGSTKFDECGSSPDPGQIDFKPSFKVKKEKNCLHFIPLDSDPPTQTNADLTGSGSTSLLFWVLISNSGRNGAGIKLTELIYGRVCPSVTNVFAPTAVSGTKKIHTALQS